MKGKPLIGHVGFNLELTGRQSKPGRLPLGEMPWSFLRGTAASPHLTLRSHLFLLWDARTLLPSPLI